MQKYLENEETSLLTAVDEEAEASSFQDIKYPKYVIQVTSYSDKFYVLISLYTGVLLAALDGTVIASLLSHIASELGNLSFGPWIASSYMILSSAFQPLFGKLSDIFGRKRCLLTCHTLFAVGSLISGLSQEMASLILGRCVQGIGGGGLVALSSIVVSDMTPLRERGLYQGIGNISFGIGASLGGSIGGVISDKFGWRYAFLGQVGISFLAIFMVSMKLHEKNLGRLESVWSQLGRVDFFGSFSLLGSFIFFFLALNLGGAYVPWRSVQLGVLLLASLTFSFWFLRAEKRNPENSIVPLELFESATVCLCSTLCLFASMAAYSYIFHLPIFIEIVQEKSASFSGTILAINFAGVTFGSLGSGFIMKATGSYKVLLLSCGMLYIANCGNLCTFDVTTSTLKQVLTVGFLGFGYSTIVTIALVALMSSVPSNLQAVSSSILYASRGFGSTMGVAVSSSIFSNSLRHYLDKFVVGIDREQIIELALTSSDSVRGFSEQYRSQAIQSYLSSLKIVFAFIFCLSVVIGLASIPLKQHNLSQKIRDGRET
ncbi:LAMI_0A00430g1_1 [Lachancea mirantina]|uniref:LAMI_0A00430g1_1 n=1 Tax=Lachancea mirantina TaxID=1230905 RepID=A0A1G4ILK3_9SACH|nr:LAMI_0A00430g1_1 [Lachancea mirantina]